MARCRQATWTSLNPGLSNYAHMINSLQNVVNITSTNQSHQGTMALLAQVIASRLSLFGTKPLSKPMIIHCQLGLWEQTGMKFEWQFPFNVLNVSLALHASDFTPSHPPEAPEATVEQTMETPVIWDAISLIMTSLGFFCLFLLFFFQLIWPKLLISVFYIDRCIHHTEGLIGPRGSFPFFRAVPHCKNMQQMSFFY